MWHALGEERWTIPVAVVIVGLSLLGGCTAAEHAIAPTKDMTTSLSRTASNESNAQGLAQGIAKALSDPSIRAHLRHAMRDSRWIEHKLLLQDYAKSEHGGTFVAAIAKALNSRSDEVAAMIAALPQLDMYLPFREDRLAWRGSPDMLVTTAFHKWAPTLEAFSTDGSSQTIRLGERPPVPLLILHPAEPKFLIASNSPRSTGEEIQGAGESEGSGTEDTGGRYATSFLQECGESGCDTGGGSVPPPPAPGVYLIAWDAAGGDGWWGNVELQFDSYAVSGGFPQYMGNGYWYLPQSCFLGGFRHDDPPTHHEGLYLVSPNVTNVSGVSCNYSQAIYGFQVTELDGGVNGTNDDYGRRFFYPGTSPFGGIVCPAGAPWYQCWQDYNSMNGVPPGYGGDGDYTISLTLEYR